jgi:hypothetical protein
MVVWHLEFISISLVYFVVILTSSESNLFGFNTHLKD